MGMHVSTVQPATAAVAANACGVICSTDDSGTRPQARHLPAAALRRACQSRCLPQQL
jgi:hypothetical protein